MSKIKDVRLTHRRYYYKKPFHITNSISSYADNVEVEITTDSGIKAIGEASPSMRVCGENKDTILTFENRLKEIMVDKDITRYLVIFRELNRFISSSSLKAAVEFAILDAFSMEMGIEVYRFLGGDKTEIETDKTVSIGSIEERVKEAVEIKKSGFNIIKIKVGENLEEDIESIEEIYRKTKGVKYIVDANEGYSPKEALYFARKLYTKGIDIAVYEQPVKRYDIEGLRFVRFNSPYPVAGDESARTAVDVLNLIKKEAVDFVNIKIMKSGFASALSIIELCNSAGVDLMIGCMGESTTGIYQSVSLACGRGCFRFCDLDSHLLLKDQQTDRFVQKKNIISITL